MKSSYFKLLIIFLLFISCNNKKYTNSEKNKGAIRIVSLVPSISKQLVDLGLEDRIVGATSYCDISTKNKELIVGTAITVNVEKVLLLHPDMVFSSGLTNDKTIQKLRNNGVKVYQFGKMKSFDDICDQFIELGTYVGKEHTAKLIVEKARVKVDSMRSSILKQKDSLKVFFQVGTKPIFSVIPNTFMDDYITFSGCRNIASDLTRGTINRETVINRNPDVIFIISMGIIGEKEKEIWKNYPELNAAKNNKIFIVDANIAASPTVDSFLKTLEIVISDIHK